MSHNLLLIGILLSIAIFFLAGPVLFWVGIVATIVIFFALMPESKEGMAYLDQYEKQDNFYNTTPRQWPVVDTDTTALYTVRRGYIEQEKRELEAKGCGPQGL